MIPTKETKMDDKKMTVIEDLVDQGVFKVEGKQLYELIKEHMEHEESEI